MATVEAPKWSEEERDAFEEVIELDTREMAGGGLVRALYNRRTQTPFIELQDKGVNVTWAVEADKVLEALNHPYAVAPLGLITVREAFDDGA